MLFQFLVTPEGNLLVVGALLGPARCLTDCALVRANSVLLQFVSLLVSLLVSDSCIACQCILVIAAQLISTVFRILQIGRRNLLEAKTIRYHCFKQLETMPSLNG